MKKLIALLMCGIILAGCGSTAQAPAASSVSVSSEPLAAPASSPLTIFGEVTDLGDVYNGAGDSTIGKFGSISITKESLRKKSYKQIKEQFEKIGELAPALNYYYIYFEDGTGILFAGCLPEDPQYGALDENMELVGEGYYIEDRDTYFTLTDAEGSPYNDGKEETGINGI